MLFLIGLGISEGEISINGINKIKESDKIFLEQYTTPISDKYIELIESFGKKVTKIKRSDLEENAKDLLSKAVKENISILVPGDPLIATTHHILFLIAKNLNINIAVLHSSSIYSAAIGESRLDLYKFGPTTTVTKWTEKYKPTSFIDVIERNIKNKLHTLVLFDIINNGERTLNIQEAFKIIKRASLGKDVNLIERKMLLICDLGSYKQKIIYKKLFELNNLDMSNNSRLCMVIPGELTFAEAELIEQFS
ncbi:MAG: diphthine synthase [Candidatus Micrarchaeia archaeon]